jgi:hypothetical protein
MGNNDAPCRIEPNLLPLAGMRADQENDRHRRAMREACTKSTAQHTIDPIFHFPVERQCAGATGTERQNPESGAPPSSANLRKNRK